MGNQQAICCADTTGCHRVEHIGSSTSFDGVPTRGNTKSRLLRRFIESTFIRHHQVPRRDQVGQHVLPATATATTTTGFFKRKFASSNMEVDSGVIPPSLADNGVADKQKHVTYDKCSSITLPPETTTTTTGTSSPAVPPPPRHQFRTLSSMSTQSEFGERAREARSEQVTRRTSFCSDREGIEEERGALEPEGKFLVEAME